MNIQLELSKYKIIIPFFSTVYVPFDVQKLADELEIEYRVVSSNRISMWQMEINQIECAEKASIVKPDERQGLLFSS